MIPVSEAEAIISNQIPEPQPCVKKLFECSGYVLSSDVKASQPLPPFRASIMDGYAVVASDGIGVYPVLGDSTAGIPLNKTLSSGQVCYITTGAPVPAGADAVIMVEQTTLLDDGTVRLNNLAVEGQNIRPIGCDVAVDQVVLTKGSLIGSAEIGLLATCGVTEVKVWSKPQVGVISTGDELVNVDETPGVGQIRDSNRPMLLNAVREANAIPIDLGIVVDKKNQLDTLFLNALNKCDICILSGGVSMGSLDLVKPMLERLGTVHFGRMRMKPGKPTTFATVNHNGTQKLIFALPGNPVSCLATFNLLVKPAIRVFSGLEVVKNLRIAVRLQDRIKLDNVRPEYHRAIVYWDASNSEFIAFSTGTQRSSRLLSFQNANALLEIPRGTGALEAGTTVQAQIIGDLQPALSIERCRQARMERLASAAAAPNTKSFICNCDRPEPESEPTPTTSSEKVKSGSKHKHKHKHHHQPHNTSVSSDSKTASSAGSDSTVSPPFVLRVGVLIVSDRCARGEMQDRTGPIARTFFNDKTNFKGDISVQLVQIKIIPDDIETIKNTLIEWCDSLQPQETPNFIVTSGGTGFSLIDNTPEATRTVLEREAPGLVHFIIAESFKYTQMAALMRPVAGTRKQTLIMNLPGSTKAIKQLLGPIFASGIGQHAVKLLATGADPRTCVTVNR